MARDPYQVLGVTRTASADEIKKVYRRLAKKLHPDLNPGNAKVAEQFKEVSAAYDILSDADKRRRFDAGEIDAAGTERAPRGFYTNRAEEATGGRYQQRFRFEDIFGDSGIFSDFFGQQEQHAPKGNDVRAKLSLSLVEAARGTTKSARLPTGRVVEVKIPAGIQSGQTLRLKGQGMPGTGRMPAGDAFVQVAIAPDSTFTLKDLDVYVDAKVPLRDAVLGGSVTVPTLDGKATVTVPKGANSGQMLRLKGKGIRDSKTLRTGDQYVRLLIVLPEGGDPALEAFFRERQEKAR